MTAHKQLPHPSPEEQKHSQELMSFLSEKIQANGPLRFYDFMEQALYHPTLGYYRSKQPFGKQGDFITSAHCGPWCANALASYYAPLLSEHKEWSICEFGAGNGQMALDLLKALAEKNALPKAYAIIETSPALQTIQMKTFEAHPELRKLVVWPQSIPKGFQGIVFANEVLDAMPFHIFKKTTSDYDQLFVTESKGILTTIWQEAVDRIPDSIDALELDDDHCFEINPHLVSWLANLYRHVCEGFCFLMDYGATQSQYFSRSAQGYARAFYRHHVHDDLIRYPGLQDITTHVDFSALADAALDSGWDVVGYTNQANFLMQGGVTDMQLPDFDSPEGVLARTQIKTLMLPQEMGEAFKVMVLSKNTDDLFEGFTHDQRHKL